MSKHYIFFTRNVLPQPEAHIIHDVNTANAAANLGYSAILVYIQQGKKALNPLDWFYPFRPKKPSEELINFYNIQEKLKVIPLSMPLPISEKGGKWTHPSTYVCKYYFPVHIFPHTKILHTLDWNLVKTAIRSGIPVIYEREHDRNGKYEPEIVNSPLFQVAITVADSVRENMIKNGMPPEKIVKLHLSYNQSFLVRQPEAAAEWRKKLLVDATEHLVVYSGGLYKFKGVDLLLDVAKELPRVQFAFAGGNETQLKAYRQLVQEKQIKNAIFLGYIQHERLPSLLQAADILAHPHLSGQAATFTSPLKFFEYLASGTPIVASEIPPLIEFKTANIVAGWCETDSVVAYTRALQQALETHPRKVEGYSEQIEFARQFSWESRLAKIMSYVDESLQPSIVY
ncbi:glycosyl transferase family 1 [Hydrococcus rivularis NIES-593]|uniref:Glycosyl transferase family 1 n=1 Tax=Hydrococcus rivularis NIES-593 TaxID=1921803 RepID=A0A1U7HMS5_9CYAN|nr:glycosyltransferase [Hydrococcus rivularis]OKH24893.1 glycosyl transferase family 1 [Hydrococcus rivularis NIES-593]